MVMHVAYGEAPAYYDARGLWWSPRPFMMHVAYGEAPGLL